jgi:Flp pilus assembly protein TadG
MAVMPFNDPSVRTARVTTDAASHAVRRCGPGRRPRGRRAEGAPRGQAMVEFALVLPILIVIVLGIMQFGLLFWSQITLTQVARDTGRWAATQQACAQGTGSGQADVIGEAHSIAAESQLLGYEGASDPDLTISPTWTAGSPCPPEDNTTVKWVSIDMAYSVDVFLPLIAQTCTPTCRRTLTTEVQFRMEPEPAP